MSSSTQSRMPNKSINSLIGEWNSLLFSAFIPQAWTVLLDVLAHQDLVRDIYEYWPPPGAMNDYIAPASESGTDLKHIIGPNTPSVGGSKLSGVTTRSRGMLQTVFDRVVVSQAQVWPIYVALGQSVSSALPAKPSFSLSGPSNILGPLRPLISNLSAEIPANSCSCTP